MYELGSLAKTRAKKYLQDFGHSSGKKLKLDMPIENSSFWQYAMATTGGATDHDFPVHRASWPICKGEASFTSLKSCVQTPL
jgi:hypothetical protein